MSIKATHHNSGRAVKRVLWITLGLNLLVCLLKLGYGYWTGALTMVADGYHSLLDSSSNVVGLVALHYAHKPPDQGHPYGHHKVEAISAMLISGMLFLACYEILFSAYHRFYDQSIPEVTLYSFLIMIGTMIINFGVSRYEQSQGEAHGSQILVADAAHTRSDVFVSLSVICALIGIYFNFLWIDFVGALLIALFVGYSGYQIVVSSFSTLMDSAQLDPQMIRDLALEVDGVKECHSIRTRGHSASIYMDLNIHVEPTLSIGAAHDLTHQVVKKIQEVFPEVVDVVVHTEPAEPHE